MAQVSLPHHHSSSMHADKDRSVVGNFMACLDIQSNAAHASVPRFAIPSAMETDMPENNSHMSMSPPASASDVCCHGITRSCSLCSVCSASSSVSAASLGSPAPGHYNIACALDPSPLGKAVPTHDHSHFQSHSIQQQQQQYLVHQPRPVHLASGNQHPSSACTSITPLTRAPSYHGSVSSAAVRPACNLLRPPAAPKPALAFPQHSQPLSSQSRQAPVSLMQTPPHTPHTSPPQFPHHPPGLPSALIGARSIPTGVAHLADPPNAPSAAINASQSGMPQQPRPKDYPLQPQPPDQSKALQLLASHSLHPDFAARFEVTSELGSGGFGFVLGAIDHLTGREVAVKFIMRSRVPDTAWVKDQDLGAIPLEVFFLRHCNHKNIISFVAVYTDSTYVYLVTELHGSQWTAAKDHIGAASQVPVQDPTQMLGLSEKATAATPGYVPAAAEPPHMGHSLSAIAESTSAAKMLGSGSTASRCATAVPPPLTRSNTCPLPAKLCRRPSMDLFECIEQFDRIPEDVAKFIFRQVAEAIRYLHSKSVVHRDIKDENIVIDNNFHVKIIDFGSAAIEHPDPGFLFDRFQGTIQYASPEILRGEKYRGRPSDIWAMGVLLYTILYGEVPFASSEQAKNYNFKPPRLPSSPECMNLLNWMLQKHASKRPTSEQVLRHPWMAIAPAITRTTTTVGNMCIS